MSNRTYDVDPEIVSGWLANTDGFGASDEEFAETMVLLYQRNVEGKKEAVLTADDMKNFSTEAFVDWMQRCLDEILFSEEMDTAAWWKQDEESL